MSDIKVTEFEIKGPLLIEPKVHRDGRGFFVERYRRDRFTAMGLPEFIQDNFSRSQAGVLRGLHYQFERPQGKLISVVSGRILDVALDIRAGSKTFGRHISVRMDGENPAWLWIPPGFAHGFQVLGGAPADILYKVDQPYNREGEGGIAWNDGELGIAWEPGARELSARDQTLPAWPEYRRSPAFS